MSPLSRWFASGVAHSGVARFLSSPVVRLSEEGYPSLEGSRSVHCMARCRRPTSLALSSSSVSIGTRCHVPTVPVSEYFPIIVIIMLCEESRRIRCYSFAPARSPEWLEERVTSGASWFLYLV